MKNLFPCPITLAAVLCTSLLFSCSSDLEMPPPPVGWSSSSLGGSLSSSSSVVSSSSAVSSSSTTQSSSSSVPPSSSSLVELSSSSLGLSSSSLMLSSSSTAASSSSVVSSSSYVVTGVGLCAGFVNGTKREHYGKEKEQFCDERDGKKYVYVTIGEQIWMAENLNYNATGSKCYSNSEANCTTCGKLYNWATAMANVCPSGWHLPSDAEWNVLMKSVNPDCTDNSSCAGAGTKLKSASLWTRGGVTGTDNFGFSALPGGYGISGGNFLSIGNFGIWWSSSEDNSNLAYCWGMFHNNEGAAYYNSEKSRLHSVRCLHD